VRALIAGLINLETTVPVEAFPLRYQAVRFNPGIAAAVSGVGWNLARALHALGSQVHFLGLVGPDPAGRMVRHQVASSGIAASLEEITETPQSVILYDPEGRRRAETDLKGVQEAVFPPAVFDTALEGCDLAVLANVNWTRPLLARARAAGAPVATDLHTVRSLDNPYDVDYLEHATVLFLSGEELPVSPEAFVSRLRERADPEVIGIGLGARGALVAPRGAAPALVPAPALRPVVSTIGAGDALFAAFLHFWRRHGDPVAAMSRAVAFAAWKVGEASASAGFLTEAAVEALCR
jgi:sugar/nucleoside kinase (ribokinase family)